MTTADLRKHLPDAALVASAAALLLVFAAKLLPVFHGETIGHDYAFAYPKLAAYYYWIERNGLFAVPHFLPYMCAGIFDFADPQSSYFSFPTGALLLLPIAWIWPATALLFALVGIAGSYLLARRGLGIGPMPALLCACLILFNGYYATRMAVGHVQLHGFMLLPWLALLCLQREPFASLATARNIVGIGLIYAYLVHSGGYPLVIPSIISILVILVARAANARELHAGVGRLMAGGLFGVLISAPRLIEMLHLMSVFPRNQYPLPGFASVFDTLQFMVAALFFWPSENFLTGHLVNTRFALQVHEAIYHVSVLPIAALALFLLRPAGEPRLRWSSLFGPRGIALLLLLALPVALNTYEPHWNALLKRVPIIGQSSNLVRYTLAYIVPFAAFTAWVFERTIAGTALRAPLFAGAVAIVLSGFLSADLQRFTRPGYDAKPIEDAFDGANYRGRRPITEVGAFIRSGQLFAPVGRDDIFLDGRSQILCYQAIFGYRLENMPLGNLRPGPATDLRNGTYNFRNPACYVFPRENDCRPGDNFRDGQIAELETFLDYGPLAYAEPGYLPAARAVSLAALGSALLALLAPLLRRIGVQPRAAG